MLLENARALAEPDIEVSHNPRWPTAPQRVLGQRKIAITVAALPQRQP